MEGSTRTIWFEGTNEIDCSLNQVSDAFKNIGDHFVEIVGLMPGMTSVELLEQGRDFVTIKTNEGLMNRANISIITVEGKITVEFDEEYKAEKMITARSHFLDEFVSKDSMVQHHLAISDLHAPGFMGFFYKKFGSSNIGKAFLESYKSYFEK